MFLPQVDKKFLAGRQKNFFREKKYLLKVRDNVNIDNKTFKIENKVFSKWISEHRDIFLIKKQMTFD